MTSAAGEPWQIGERAARALRSELGLGDAPIDIRDVIQRRGVQLATDIFPDDWGDGRYLKKGSRYLIILNAAGGPARAARARFTAAHELGHHELHRDNQDVVIYIDTDVHSGGKSRPEREADAFAAYLLAPTEALKRDLADVPPREVAPELVADLMRRYGLSYRATVYRMHNAGAITAGTRNRLISAGEGRWTELQAIRGGREDDAFFLNRQLPSDYRSAALKLYENRHIELPRLAELLRLDDLEEVQKIVSEAGIEREPGLEPDDDAVAALLALADDPEGDS